MDAIGERGGVVATLLPPKSDLEKRSNVNITPILSYTAVGKAFIKGDGAPETPAKPEDRDFARTWWETMQNILRDEPLVLSQLTLQHGGLEGISSGLEAGKSGMNGAGVGGKMVDRLI